jgi:sugar phosphate isomerase/epimerase
MQRRNFIKTTALSAAALSVGSLDMLESKKKPTLLSLQLYSVRDAIRKDPIGVIDALSKIGFKDGEHAGYNGEKRQFYGYSPLDWKKILSDHGMTMKSGHTVLGPLHYDMANKSLTDLWKTTVEDAILAGQEYIISPSLNADIRKNSDDLKKFLDGFNIAGTYCKSKGIRFGYHNHDFEFNTKLDNKLLMDIIMEHTDPAVVAHQIDIGNMYGGGGHAMDFLKKYPGRYELMHVKDEIKTPNSPTEHYESCILGKGIIGTKDVIKYARKKSGTFYLIIEQESYQGMDPLAAMKEDYNIMKEWGY